MSYTFSNPDPSVVENYRGWFIAWGILLVILGILAIAADVFTTMISVVLLGTVILIGGILILIDSFNYWKRGVGSFFLHVAVGILYLVAGILLITNPVAAAVSLTLILALFYIVIGVFRIIGSIAMRMPQWGWVLFNGLVALLLGILILANWPAASLFIIGLFVGIDLIITGLAYIMLASAVRKVVRPAQPL